MINNRWASSVASAAASSPQNPEFDLQYKVERHFFRRDREEIPNWKHHQAFSHMVSRMENSRIGFTQQNHTIDITDIAPRIAVLAEVYFTDKAIQLAGTTYDRNGFPESCGYRFRRRPIDPPFMIGYCIEKPNGYPDHWTSEESVIMRHPIWEESFAIISYASKAAPHQNHKGDCRVDFAHIEVNPGDAPVYLWDHRFGSYDHIATRLAEIAPTPRQEQGLASLLLNHGTSFNPFKAIRSNDLNRALGIPQHTPLQMQLMTHLRDTFFHELKPERPSTPDLMNTPFFVIFISRTLRLAAEGKCKLEELFMQDPIIPGGLCRQNIEVEKLKKDLCLLTEGNPEKEKGISSLLLKYVQEYEKCFRPITFSELQKLEISPAPENVQFMNDLYYLLFVKEIARRRNPENPHVDLPIAISLIRALKLVGEEIFIELSDSHTLYANSLIQTLDSVGKRFDKQMNILHISVRLNDVLSQNAPLGVFTEPSLARGDDVSRARRKIDLINLLYARHFQTNAQDAVPAGRALMNELKEVFGGASDTDEDTYDRL